MAKTITVIPATVERFTQMPFLAPVKKKVAGYARVSTDKEEQAGSYDAQMKYYENYIKSRSDWEFVGMYSDEGISGTNTKHREGFNSMVEDALAGKIDLIITKSVSRFARNTVDSLTTVRKLKEKGIEIYFEKENIWTLDAKGELLITIMSSLAQEESRSISENSTWGRRKRFAEGKTSCAFSRFLGYDKDYIVNEEEAKIIRRIFALYIKGLSTMKIADLFNAEGVRTPSGKGKWSGNTVLGILKNEKYKGDALIQKRFTVDFLTKKMKKNEGEVPQYYVRDHHEAIIDRRTFDLVQHEYAKRKSWARQYNGTAAFVMKLVCGQCGGFYGAKVWHSNDKYRRIAYRCNHKYDHAVKCTTPHMCDQEIRDCFLRGLNQVVAAKEQTMKNLELLMQMAKDTSALDVEKAAVETEIENLAVELKSLIQKSVNTDEERHRRQVEYDEKYATYCDKVLRLNAIAGEYDTKNYKVAELETFIEGLADLEDSNIEFDEDLFTGLVDCITFHAKDNIVLKFKGGLEVQVSDNIL